MAMQQYSCLEHGEFIIHVPMEGNCPITQPCPQASSKSQKKRLTIQGAPEEKIEICGQESPWIPSAPAVIIFDDGGTGAGRLRHTR